jgi:flagellar protein FlaG
MESGPKITVSNSDDFRESYANSVQVRWSVWDFFILLGTFQQQSEDTVEVKNFQGVYLSPQQAKALMMLLDQNVANYEKTFGEIKLDPHMAIPGIVN